MTDIRCDHRWATFPEFTQPICLDCGEYAPYDLRRFETWQRTQLERDEGEVDARASIAKKSSR